LLHSGRTAAGHGAKRGLFPDLRGRRNDWLRAAEREFVAESEATFKREEKAKHGAENSRRVARHRTARQRCFVAVAGAGGDHW
jgi:hypothetical protein